MVAAGSCILDHNDTLQVDISSAHLEEPKATFVLAFDNVEKKIVASHTTGSFSSDLYQNALVLCRIQCEQVFEFFKSTFSSKK